MPQSEYWPFKVPLTPSDSNAEPSVMQKQIGAMEGEVKEIQMELEAIRRDRMNLHARKPSFVVPADSEDIEKNFKCLDMNKIHEDTMEYARIPQISKLREDLIKAKTAAEEERFQREKYEGKLKDLEIKLNGLCSSTLIEDNRKKTNEELTSLKKQLRGMGEEMEEMKVTIAEKDEQLQEYRLKYLQAQQQVEEYKRQFDLIEYDNKQVSDQIQIEIQKMKMQFQEKLQELAPLPDLLKGAQIQLQEAKQLQKLAEENSQELSNELHRVKEKLVLAVNNLNQEKADKIKLFEENKEIKTELDDKRLEIDDLNRVLDDYKCNILRLEEKLSQLEARYKEKASESIQLVKDLDEIRSESARSLTRNKERSDSLRRYMQTQISELERQLIQSRAQCRSCLKERDDIRQRMQIQISNLQENFDMVEIRLRTLQSQITSLKNSYAVILADEDDTDINKIVTTTCD
ncbi:outer dense fiber protein 2-like isoform X1 [Pieris rapae]|uniref:outer dense fiber protein 2-like isoform X1 n=2 Tax=Pieris rapae TaxID=64459 RepID=UPI001E27CFD1|nr:outer dense fiber protein 2-like isoform X1 [Pieris rapae]